MGNFWGEKKREEVILGKIHRNIFELQVPGKGPHPILIDFPLALKTYQRIPPDICPSNKEWFLMQLFLVCISLTAVLLSNKISL